ncbi:large conductance mechanosensitive channel protein MscL [Timonella senegalensis]|jgi:large conductance mechanosensitive channel|uniref:large conductance mechanosensitive channel protein MscL n=1 Tax=Timonella senegalensis TaxID=1465825 RepID=UPI0002D87093|nr:large conductance mechanosensitive channel protein MscL [Timonella senegalensis]
MKSILDGFKEFVLRGSVIDLAVGVVIGGAFSKIVTSLVDNFMSPLIATVFGEPDFSQALILTINGAQFKFGAILTDIISFLAIAAALYFCIVLPLNKVHEMRKSGQIEEPDAPAEDVLLLQEIRDLLKAQRTN